MRKFRSIIRAKMGQTKRHSMPIYANAHVHANTKKDALALLLRGWGAFCWSYCSTIGVLRYANVAEEFLQILVLQPDKEAFVYYMQILAGLVVVNNNRHDVLFDLQGSARL